MRKLAFVLIGMVVILSGLWMASRALPPTEQQQQALATLCDPPGFEGSNAFPALWLMPYAVPREEWDTVIAADIAAHLQAWETWTRTNGSLMSGSTAANHYSSLRPDAADRDLFCQSGRGNCLDQVRVDVDAVGELVTRHEPLLDRIEALAEHDFVQNVFPPKLFFQAPAFQVNQHLHTRHALHFVEGRVDEALLDTCDYLLTWRRLGTNSDTLIVRLVGHSQEIQRSAVLLADMLAELPPGYPLPAGCSAVQELPDLDALGICQPLQGEFQSISAAHEAMDQLSNLPSNTLAQRARKPLHRLVFDGEATNARIASSYGQWCNDDMRDTILADDPAPTLVDPPGRFSFRCLSNILGCQLSGLVSAQMVSPFHVRHLDYGAKRRLLGALIWLQQNAVDGDFAEAFGRLPAEFQSETRPLRLDVGDNILSVPLHNQSESPEFSLPLPGARAI